MVPPQQDICQATLKANENTSVKIDAFVFDIALCYAITDQGALEAPDNAVPLSLLFSKANEVLSCPVPATLFVGMFPSGLPH